MQKITYLLDDDFVARIIAVVVDEAHCIAKWYVELKFTSISMCHVLVL